MCFGWVWGRDFDYLSVGKRNVVFKIGRGIVFWFECGLLE